MKIKLTALICVAAMLVGLLAGCGAETAETVAETETQPVVTTMATEAPTEFTEPTEPPTLFEELEIELWGGYTPQTTEDNWIFDVPAKGIGVWHINMGVPYVSRKDANSYNIVTSKITDTNTSISIEEIPKEWMLGGKPSEGEPYRSLLDAFYNIYKSKESQPVDKEEWIEQYRFLSVGVFQDVKTAECIKEDEALGSPLPSFQVGTIEIIDMNTGVEITPSPINDGNIGVFSFGADEENCEIMASWSVEVQFLDDLNGKHRQRLFVLVSRDYDGLAFSYNEFIKPFTQEVFTVAMTETYEQPWIVGSVTDEPDEIDKLCKKFYFNYMLPEE